MIKRRGGVISVDGLATTDPFETEMPAGMSLIVVYPMNGVASIMENLILHTDVS